MPIAITASHPLARSLMLPCYAAFGSLFG